ncbi:unnamed protein product (macronuclear) [Paramecium tetraurelia]|uniref:Uncharacterized protein n=1 Tax=Paramecium tetraurelia TaxID=5888 RepID=A0C6Q2_PARTE|nr:uncharacterized protein GSPATT00035598001 [Paramecium tetraurelia]CAK66469.1 unnamed protein product [Paramecium tetraurelia]|eukprot:XP_001433866.1 hypothetical protein (macronuclear) [Paramecium tetraurelia strain d4-2]
MPINYAPIPSEIENYKIAIHHLTEENLFLRKQLQHNQVSDVLSLDAEQLKDEVFKMIDYLMKNLNYLPKEQIFAYRKTIRSCTQRSALKRIYFLIFTRYLQAEKTKEEMIKFILRKSVKFQKPTSPIQKHEMKKMNNAFVQQLFLSPQYQSHYSSFLSQYLQLALDENKQKIQKYVNFIVESISNDQIEDVLNYKRFPWLNEWIQQSVQIAKDLQFSSKPQSLENKKKRKF